MLYKHLGCGWPFFSPGPSLQAFTHPSRLADGRLIGWILKGSVVGQQINHSQFVKCDDGYQMMLKKNQLYVYYVYYMQLLLYGQWYPSELLYGIILYVFRLLRWMHSLQHLKDELGVARMLKPLEELIHSPNPACCAAKTREYTNPLGDVMTAQGDHAQRYFRKFQLFQISGRRLSGCPVNHATAATVYQIFWCNPFNLPWMGASAKYLQADMGDQP